MPQLQIECDFSYLTTTASSEPSVHFPMPERGMTATGLLTRSIHRPDINYHAEIQEGVPPSPTPAREYFSRWPRSSCRHRMLNPSVMTDWDGMVRSVAARRDYQSELTLIWLHSDATQTVIGEV